MSKTILIAEDSTSVRRVICCTLQRGGFAVVEATDGLDAVDKLRTTKVDMVITDLNMPRMGGIALIKQIRADPAHRFVPIAMLTTDLERESKMEGKRAGATAWVIKPFTNAQLLGVVKKVLGA